MVIGDKFPLQLPQHAGRLPGEPAVHRLTIVLARFVPIIRSFAPLVAGAAKMSRLNFEVSGTVGAVLWAGIILAAGHLFGNIPFIKNNLSLILVGGIVLGLAPFVIGYIVKKWRQHPDEK